MCILTNCTVHLYNAWLGWPAAPQRAEALYIHIYIYGCIYIYICTYTHCTQHGLPRAGPKPYGELERHRREARSHSNCVYRIQCTVGPGQSGNQPPAHNFQLPQHQQLLRTTSHSQSQLSTPGAQLSISGAQLPIPGAQLSMESWVLGVESWTRDLKVEAREGFESLPWGQQVGPQGLEVSPSK